MCIGFNFKHEDTKVSQRVENVKLAILEAMVKGYYECSSVVGVGEKSVGPFLIIETLSFNL